MMKLINIPFLVITLSTITGILISEYILISLKLSLLLVAICIGILYCIKIYTKRSLKKGSLFYCWTIISFSFFGIALSNIHKPTNYNHHYSNIIPDLSSQKHEIYFYVREQLRSSNYYHRYIVNIRSVDGKSASGHLLLKIIRTKENPVLIPGTSYIVYTSFSDIPFAKNPSQFDYSIYLQNKYIYHQISASYPQLIKSKEKFNLIHNYTYHLREHLIKKLEVHHFSPTQLSLIKALFLGQKQNIATSLLTDYRRAGALHILALSGLHIGILLLLLQNLLTPIHRFGKKGKYISVSLTIIFLWFFAILTGVSPSILRATVMFSFIALGTTLATKASIYNAIIISIFVILCYHPMFIYDVGFQLSYAAVLSIVLIKPRLDSLLQINGIFYRKLRDLITVPIAAQIGILPISLFYFHEFPLLFLLTNLLVIPFLGSTLLIGFIAIILVSINLLPDSIAALLGVLLDGMNGIISWISSHDFAMISSIPFSGISVILTLLTIFTLFRITYKNKKTSYMFFFSSLIVLICNFNLEQRIRLNTNRLIIYHTIKNSVIGIHNGNKLAIYSSNPITSAIQKQLYSSYKTQYNIHQTTFEQLKNIYQYDDQLIMVIDSSMIYTTKKTIPDVLLLTNSPKINLERVIQTLAPKLIVADGSNYRSMVQLWQNTCIKKQVPFYNTNTKGAFILER
ncbi:ComEC/Rec2 family competence protein [Aquimarina hainanensis]|uniref:ComEC/Rec2 family competence protein n=1 Tax=Aquimarina hainanensis TaxID=1578017 RepID=A0ABW5N8Z5_9FLAO